MDLDPEGIFRDDSDSDHDFFQEREASKEYVVYLVDASPKMFSPAVTDEDEKMETHFHVAINCISQVLKTQIIGRSNDEVTICFFNTREKKNLQNLNGVYVFDVMERESLDKPTAKLIKEFSSIEDNFMNSIGSQYGIISGSRENSIYNALWVGQALLRKGSTKNVSKRMLIFTNEDDPFGTVTGATKKDMIRTTLQRAKDAQDLGISIELLPLSSPDEKFDVSVFYSDLIGLEAEEVSQFLPSVGERLEDMTSQLKKRMFTKRKIRSIWFSISNDICIEVNTYALIRPTLPGAILWLDSVTNLPLKSERFFICADTGALLQEPPKRFHLYRRPSTLPEKITRFFAANSVVSNRNPPYWSESVVFSTHELSQIKKVSNVQLRLLGFKPLDCLKDYHNLRPSTFIFPSDEEIVGSTRIFIALHRSMLRLNRYAVAFYGISAHPQLVALVAQEEIMSSSGQVEPPGMHMIYLPYSDDIRQVEELHTAVGSVAPRATDEQIEKASNLLRRMDLKDFSVCQFSNPALQRHYGILEALALGEDEMPDIKDETWPDEEGLARPRTAHALEDFKIAVYGENHDQEEVESMVSKSSASKATKKRKATAEAAVGKYNWAGLADNGKLKDLTVVELKHYLTAYNLPVAGKKEVLISRILTHLGK